MTVVAELTTAKLFSVSRGTSPKARRVAHSIWEFTRTSENYHWSPSRAVVDVVVSLQPTVTAEAICIGNDVAALL